MTLYSIPPFLTLVCFAGLTVLTLLRLRKTKVNLLFLFLCILGTFLYADIFLVLTIRSLDAALFISRLDHFFIVYTIPVYLHFFHAYLGIEDRKWLIRAAYGYAFLLMCITPTPLYISGVTTHWFGNFARGGALYPFFGLGGVAVTLYVLFLLTRAVLQEKNRAVKIRHQFVLVGFGAMALLAGLSTVTIFGYPMYPPGNFNFIPLIIFGIGMFRFDLLNMGIFFKKSLIYSILTALLTLIYALAITAANRIFKGFHLTDSMWFHFLFFLFIALMLGPVKTVVQRLMDRIFDKGKYDYQQTLKQTSRMIASVLDLHTIGHKLTQTLFKDMALAHCALFLRQGSGADFVNFASQGPHSAAMQRLSFKADAPFIGSLEKRCAPMIKKQLRQSENDPNQQAHLSALKQLRSEIVFPMIFKAQLNGFIALGEKKSGDLFLPEDLDLLETLSSQSALAVENARAYKTIEDLNKNLEQKVKDRTRALQEALAEKERTQEQLIRSESLAAIGQLVAGTAHEMNNPLATVKSLVQSSIEDLQAWDGKTAPDEELLDDLKFADKELNRARSIVASLLGLSRQTQTYLEAVSLNTVIKDALRVLHNQHKYRDIEIIENYDTHLPTIQGNFANLGQVAINIIKNAAQAAAQKSGKIVLTTRHDKARQQIVFMCEDNGAGIPEGALVDIFKPFFTTKPVGQGTGLGLYICHEIIQKHGGDITVKNLVGTGACFVIRLPLNHP